MLGHQMYALSFNVFPLLLVAIVLMERKLLPSMTEYIIVFSKKIGEKRERNLFR